jgi:hypothetical protein
VVVFGAVVVVVCVVVTGGVGRVVVDLVVVVVTTGATGAVVVTTGGEVVTEAAAVVLATVLWCLTAFLRAFLWCTTRLWGVAATVDVELVDELVEELLELPQPATSTLAAIAPSTASRICPTPVVALRTSPQANNG